jgi:hypothetical protein
MQKDIIYKILPDDVTNLEGVSFSLELIEWSILDVDY